MISFSKNARVALYLIRSYIYISTVPIALLCGGAIGSGGAGHFAVFTRRDDFLKQLRTRVLPLIP